MAITSKRHNHEITISGISQSVETVSIQGKIDQIIFESSVANQLIDFRLVNFHGQEIYKKEQLFVNTTHNELRPGILPRGPMTIYLENPSTVSGTITVTIIEKERGS